MGKEKRISIHIAAGPLLFLLCVFMLPTAAVPMKAAAAMGLILWMLYWWITRPVHLAITALIPIAVNSVMEIAPMSTVLGDYFSPIVVLLLGASLLIAAWTSTGLHRRIALRSLTVIGPSVRGQLMVWYALATVSSMFLPNAVVAAVLCPIAAAMMGAVETGAPGDATKTRYFILLAIVWGAGIGGFGTPLGGAMNLVAIEYIEKLTGAEFMYITWTARMLPYLLILSAGICAYLLLIPLDTRRLPGSRRHFRSLYGELGSMGRDEKTALTLFAAAVAVSFARPLYEGLLPGFKPFYAFLAAGIAAMLIPSEKGGRLITWEQASGSINWGLILLFSGGLAAGNLILSSGAAQSLADLAQAVNLSSPWALIVVFTALGMLLANASSNTAATAVLIPVVISVVSLLGRNPLPYLFPVAAACNCAFVLPTSIRAIPVGYGLDIGFMFRKGWAAVAITLILLTAAGCAALLL